MLVVSQSINGVNPLWNLYQMLLLTDVLVLLFCFLFSLLLVALIGFSTILGQVLEYDFASFEVPT